MYTGHYHHSHLHQYTEIARVERIKVLVGVVYPISKSYLSLILLLSPVYYFLDIVFLANRYLSRIYDMYLGCGTTILSPAI